MEELEEFVVVVLDNKMALDKDSKKQYAITVWVTQSDVNSESQTRVMATKRQISDSSKRSVTCYTAKVPMRIPRKSQIDSKNEHLLWIHLEEDQSTTSYASLDKVNHKSLKADFPSTRFKRKAPYPLEGGIGYIPLEDVINSARGGCLLYDMKLSGGDIPVEKACAFVSRARRVKDIDVDDAIEIRARTWMAETQSGNIYLRKFIDKYITYFMAPFVYDSKKNTVMRCRTVGGPSTAGLIFAMAPFTIGRALRDTYVMEDEGPLTLREKSVDIPGILCAWLDYSSSRRGKNIFDIIKWVESVSDRKSLTDTQLVELQRWNQIITGTATDAATSVRYTADASEVYVEGKGNVRVSTESWDSILAGSLGDDCEGLACFTVSVINMFRYLDWEDLCKSNPKMLALFNAIRFVRSFFACFMVVGSVSSAYISRNGGAYPTIGSNEDMAHLGGHGWAMDAPIARLVSMLEDCMNRHSEPSDDSAEFKEKMFGNISETYKMAKSRIHDYISKVRPNLPMKIDAEKKMGVLTLEGTGPIISDLEMLAYPQYHYEFTRGLKNNQELDVVPRLPRLNHLPDERWTDFYKTMVDIMGRDLNTFFGGYSARTVTYHNGTVFIGAHMEHFIAGHGAGFFINPVYTSASLKKDEVYQDYLKYIVANRPKQGIAEHVYMERYKPIRAHVDFETIEEFTGIYKDIAKEYLSRNNVNFLQLFCEAIEHKKHGSPLKYGETTFSVTKRPSLFFLDKDVAKEQGPSRYVKKLTQDIEDEMKEHVRGILATRYGTRSKVTRIKIMIIRHSPTTESRIEIMYCVDGVVDPMIQIEPCPAPV